MSPVVGETINPPRLDALTPREIEVLRQVGDGATNKEIAADLGVAVSTVERHLVNLYTKIGARGRADAIALRAATSPAQSLRLTVRGRRLAYEACGVVRTPLPRVSR
jgi:DNA-binding CsgD family transcriptional regulator